MRRRISIRGCVRPSARSSVRRAVGPSGRNAFSQMTARRIFCRVFGLVYLKPHCITLYFGNAHHEMRVS